MTNKEKFLAGIKFSHRGERTFLQYRETKSFKDRGWLVSRNEAYHSGIDRIEDDHFIAFSTFFGETTCMKVLFKDLIFLDETAL